MTLQQFKNGGVNITGFQLVNQTSKYVERFQRRWKNDVRTGSNNKSHIKVCFWSHMNNAEIFMCNGIQFLLDVFEIYPNEIFHFCPCKQL